MCALAGNWNVARMLARVPHPYTRDQAEAWIALREADWRSGGEITFCIELNGDAVGSIGLQRNASGLYELGYWLGEPWWGQEIMTEAAREVVRFALNELGAERLISGHFLDNAASGRVLEKCGFRYTAETMQYCAARGEAVAHRNFERGRDEGRDRTVAS